MPIGTTDAYPLWLYYKLDENFGPTITDYSGNSRSGTIGSGTSPSTSGGQYGGCLTISNGAVTIPTFSWAAPVTVAFWVKQVSGYDGTQRVLFRTTDDLAGLYIDTNNYLQFVDSSGLSTTNSSSPLTAASGWVHVAVVITSSTGVRLSVNGSTVFTGGGFATGSMSSTKIGYNGTMAAHGSFDDFRIYPAELTGTEITTLIANQNLQLLKPSHPAVAGSGVLTGPQYQGSATISRSHPLVVGSSHFPISDVTATSAVIRNHPTVAGTAHAAPPAYTGTAALTKHPVVAGTSVFSVPYRGSTPTPPPLFLSYAFDETTGTTCSDASGNGRDGTAASATFTAGKYNNCISLGSAGKVTTPTITWAQPLTVAFWYRGTGGSGTTRGIVSNASNQLAVFIGGSNTISFSPLSTASAESVASTTTISLSTWYHVVCTLASGTNIKIYINGTLEDHKEGLSTPTKTSNIIGLGGSFPPNGDVDEFRIYNAILTAGQIAGLYAGVDPAGSLIATHATLSGSGTMTTSVAATATLSRSHPTLASTAHFVKPIYAATATLSRTHPTAAGTAVGTQPVYAGNSTAIFSHPTIASTGIKVPEGVLNFWMSGSDGTHWVDSLPLLIIGAGEVDASLDMIIPKVVSQPLTNNLDLYLDSSDIGDFNIGMNLVVKAGAWAGKTTTLPCSITGGDQVGFAMIPLAIKGDTARTVGSMNLVVLGPDLGDLASNLNVYIKGGGPILGGTIPLYLANTPPTTSSLKLFILGPPGTPGAIPLESIMNLWIEWGAQGVIPLVINPGMVGDSTTIVVAGLGWVEDSLMLSVTGDGGVIYNNLDLAIPNVYVPTALNNSIDIAMPKTMGLIEAICTTHINGWK